MGWGRHTDTYTWAVINQTETLAHQRLLERLSRELGPCLLLTGSPFPTEASSLFVKSGPAYRRGSSRQRATSWLSFTIRALVEGLHLPRGTPVLTVTNPPLLPVVAWILSSVRGVRYALLIWDVYPDLLVATGLLGGNHAIVRGWRWMNARVMARASLVVTLGEMMARQVENQFGDPETATVKVIPHWAPTDEIRPLSKDRNNFALRHGQLDKITVLYAGNIGSGHGVERIVWIADKMKDNPRFSFLIVGDGLGLAKVLAEISRLHTDNVKVLPLQPWGAVPEMLAAAEIAVVIQEKGTEALSMPSKTYSSMAAGSAIMAVTASDSDLAGVVREHEVGMVCDQDDIEGAVSLLQEFERDPRKLEEARARARRAAVDVYSEKAIYEQWLLCLRGMLGPGASSRTTD